MLLNLICMSHLLRLYSRLLSKLLLLLIAHSKCLRGSICLRLVPLRLPLWDSTSYPRRQFWLRMLHLLLLLWGSRGVECGIIHRSCVRTQSYTICEVAWYSYALISVWGCFTTCCSRKRRHHRMLLMINAWPLLL